MAMTIVHHILQQMPAVGRPQRTFLSLVFSTSLALRGRVNFRPLSRDGDDSERTIARQFRRVFDGPDVHQRVRTTALHPQAEGISAQDASLIPKRGKQTFGLGHFFNGCAGRAERGLAISTLAVVDGTPRGAFTLAVAQTPPPSARATTQDQEATRVDFDAQQRRAPHHRLPAWMASHAVDGYVAKKTYLDAVVALRRHPMTKRRGEADGRVLVTGLHPQRRGAPRTYAGKVHGQHLRRFEALGTLAAAEPVHL
jgi:hypothetical protein